MTQQEKWIPYAKQSINEQDKQAVLQALSGERLTRGAQTEAFEKAIAEYVGAQFAVSFNSATSALHAAYHAAKLQEGDRVITTPNSFIASCSPALRKNVPVRFLDIARSSGNMQLERLREALQEPLSRGRYFIVPVHFSGIAVDMAQLDRLVNRPNVVVIEDAAHALGSCYPTGEKVGSCLWSQMTVLSFHPAKTLTTGEGGLVTTNDPALYHALRRYRNNGIEREKPYLQGTPALGYYEVQEYGHNFHMTEIEAALGLSQLSRLDEFVAKRRALVHRYRQELAGVANIKLFSEEYDARTAYHIFCVQIDFAAKKVHVHQEAVERELDAAKAGAKNDSAVNSQRLFTRNRSEANALAPSVLSGSAPGEHVLRTAFMQHLKERGIGTEVHYIPIYRQPVVQKRYGDQTSAFPEMEAYYEQVVTLPLYYDLTEEEVVFICREVKEIINK